MVDFTKLIDEACEAEELFPLNELEDFTKKYNAMKEENTE